MMNENWYNRQKAIYISDSAYQITSSGLIYKILEPGYQRQPDDNSLTYVKYTGNYINGTVFGSSNGIGIYQGSAVAGWREALKLIKDGGHIRFFMPYQIGYGKDGYDAIPPYTTLFFDVKLYQSTNY